MFIERIRSWGYSKTYVFSFDALDLSQENVKKALAEVLQVYTRMNGIKYVQGMNEVLAIVYYVMRDESDSFWAFTAIMNDLKDLYTAEADSTSDGIYCKIDLLNGLLRQYDYKLWKRFTEIDFPLPTLAMRWMTTLLVMDLHLPDAMRLWDVALYAAKSNHILTFSLCVSLGYLLCLSDSLLTVPDVQDSVEVCAHFGRSPDINIEDVIVVSLSVFAFEMVLRGRYDPSSDEPVLDAIVDAVDSVRMKVSAVVSSDKVQNTKQEITDRVFKARNFVSGWVGTLVNGISVNPNQETPQKLTCDEGAETPEVSERWIDLNSKTL
jgi:hypothetical protein